MGFAATLKEITDDPISPTCARNALDQQLIHRFPVSGDLQITCDHRGGVMRCPCADKGSFSILPTLGGSWEVNAASGVHEDTALQPLTSRMRNGGTLPEVAAAFDHMAAAIMDRRAAASNGTDWPSKQRPSGMIGLAEGTGTQALEMVLTNRKMRTSNLWIVVDFSCLAARCCG
jgi:hypothetical protein